MAGYVTVIDGVVRFYDSSDSCMANPSDTVLTISLSRNHRCSEVKVSDYSQDKVRCLVSVPVYNL
jgi:hypothetical protein